MRFVLPLLAALAFAPVVFASNAVIWGEVRDAGTGRLMPATIEIRTAAGEIVADHPSFRGGFRSPGSFEKAVLPGRTVIRVSRGFDYGAETRELNLRDGERVKLAFRLKRRAPLHRLGWVCGDSHVHMIHGERTIVVDFPYVALAGRAEALDYLSVCQQWNVPEVTPEVLERECKRVSTPDFRLAWNLEAPKNYWRGDAGKCMGHGWTVGMGGRTDDGRDAIHELMAMSAWDYESDKPPTPNFESHALIHELGGIVAYTHPHRWWWGKWGGKGIYPVEERKAVSNMAVELPFDTVAGPTYDTLDISMQPEERETNRRALDLWFLLLNHGYRIPATASSDTTFDNPGGGVPGKVRVYTLTDGNTNPAVVAHAMKAGRNFVTSGPLLLFEIDGHPVGDIIPAAPGRKHVAHLRAWPSGVPDERLTKVELIRNGEIVRTWTPRAGEGEFAADLADNGTAWYAARCYGSTERQVAVTNAIYFASGDSMTPQPAEAHVFGTVLDRATGAPLIGVVEIVAMDGRNPITTSTVSFQGGRFDITTSATRRLRVRVEGYAAEMKSIFMDSPPLLDMTLKMSAGQISDWRTFERIRELLRGVRLEFSLTRVQSGRSR